MRRLAWFVTVAVLVGLAGCSNKSSTTTTATTAATVGASTASTTPTFSGSKNSKYCDLARQFSQSLKPNLSGDPKILFQQFDALSAQYLAVVPPEIKADANTVISGLKNLEGSFQAANYDVTKIPPVALAPIQDPKFTAATQRIDAYDTQVCGLTTPTT